jgi:hypothetical protein
MTLLGPGLEVGAHGHERFRVGLTPELARATPASSGLRPPPKPGKLTIATPQPQPPETSPHAD